jgi:hypothetical protein
MNCRQCGAEIAANALICYRCGSATAAPVFRPAAPAGSRSWLIVYTVILVLMVFMAAYIEHTTSAAVPRILSWFAVVLAVLIVLFRARH